MTANLILVFILFQLSVSVSSSRVWYGNFAQFSSWKLHHSHNEVNRQVVNDIKGGNDKVLKVKYPAGSYSILPGPLKGGTEFYVLPFNNDSSVQHAILEYDVLFPNDFDFVKGGKLPGMFGGQFGCSGGVEALNCFSTRLMFDRNGGGYLYLYASKKAQHTKEFCILAKQEKDCSPHYGYGLGGSKYFVKDKWVHVKEEVKLNTPGVPNGKVIVWIDGVEKFNYDKMVLRTSNYPISGIKFNTFFGGNTPDWANPKEIYSYFKNLKFEVL